MINPFAKKFSETELELFAFLSKLPLFKSLKHKEMAYFVPYLYERSYKQHEVVFFRNDPSQALYILKEGEVVVSIDMGDSLKQLNTITSGACLGESSLLTKVKRDLNAIVKSETASFYVIPQENIFSIFQDHLKVKSKMIEALARIYYDYNSSMFKAYRSSSGFFDLQQVYD